VPWLWVVYACGALGTVLVITAMAGDLARGAGEAGHGGWVYITMAAVLVTAVAALAVLVWRRLAGRPEPVPVTAQILLGMVLAEAAAVTTFGVTQLVSAWRYSLLPPPVDTSFMDFFIGAFVFVVGLGVVGLWVTLSLLRGSRAALVCTVIFQSVAVSTAMLSLIMTHGFTQPRVLECASVVVLAVPLVLAALPSTWQWAAPSRRPVA
jgi:hypothetical protein